MALGVVPPSINERVWLDAPFKYPLPASKSPKSVAFPLVAIVMKSIIFVLLGVDPKNIPLVLLPFEPIPHPATVLSPKSCALPSVAMVTKSIKFSANGDAVLALGFELPAAPSPPPTTPRVGDEVAESACLARVESPKSDASPVDAMVINSIELVFVGPQAVSYTHLTLPTKRIV